MQLQGFKVETYGNSQIIIIIDTDQLEGKMQMSLSMTAIDFMTSTLDHILTVQGLSSVTSYFERFSKVLDVFSPYARTIVAL